MSNSERANFARRSNAPGNLQPIDPIYLELDQYENIPLAMTRITIKILVQYATLQTDSGATFDSNMRKSERDLFASAGYSLPTEHGEHAFAATVFGHKVNEYGKIEFRIHTIMHKDTGEPVTLPPVEPAAPRNKLVIAKGTVDKSIYKYHEETVTLLSAIEAGRGRKIWHIEARADDGYLFHRIEAWSEVNHMFTEAGYNALPETTDGKVALEGDAVIEWHPHYRAYRIVKVFPQAVVAPPVTEAVAPVRYVIPVTIEQSLEDRIRAFYDNPAYNEPYGYMGVFDLINEALYPAKDAVGDIVNDDKQRIPALDTEDTEAATAA